MRRATVAVAVLVLLAGCNGFGGGGGATPTDTLTPAPIVTPSPTPEDTSLAPGVEATGITDLDALTTAHRQAALNRSYTWNERTRLQSRIGNTSATPNRNQTVYFEDATHYYRVTSRLVRRVNSRLRYFPGYARYANGSVMFTRWVPMGSGTIRYVRQPVRPTDRRFAAFATSALWKYLSEGDAEVSVVLVDGRRNYAVTVTDNPLPQVNATNYTARAVIAPDGFVRSLNVTYVGTVNAARVRGHYSFAYTAVNATTVPDPDWLQVARANATNGTFP
ncbi:MAG: hypothetical protein ABEJ89_01420, partial [Haloarculaceae archaeon]